MVTRVVRYKGHLLDGLVDHTVTVVFGRELQRYSISGKLRKPQFQGAAVYFVDGVPINEDAVIYNGISAKANDIIGRAQVVN